MVKMYYDKDANWEMLNGKTIAIIGYGSQGHAHALNLKESGAKVIVGLYEGSKSWAKAEAAGLTVLLRMVSISILGKSYLLLTSTCSWSLLKDQVISYAASLLKAQACPVS